MDCKVISTHLDAYVDGELEPTPVIEFERHLDGCSDCRNELALTRLLQQGVRQIAQLAAPQSLKLRIGRALDAEPVQVGDGRDADPSYLGQGRAKGNRWTAVLSVAAALLLAAGAAMRSDRSSTQASITSDTSGPVGVLRDIVERHVDQLPADIADKPPEQVTNWLRGKVGFRVRSVEFAEPQVHFLGARVSQVADQQAAKLYYSVGDKRLTTVVFQPPPSFQRVLHDDQFVASWGAHRQRVGSRMITYRSMRGYTVPVFEQDGIVYAFTGDLDQRRLLQLVASARLP